MRTENKSGRREKERKGLKKRGGLWGCSLIQKMSIGGYTEIPNKPESMKRNTYESQVSKRKVTGCHKLIFLLIPVFFFVSKASVIFLFRSAVSFWSVNITRATKCLRSRALTLTRTSARLGAQVATEDRFGRPSRVCSSSLRGSHTERAWVVGTSGRRWRGREGGGRES